jgi:hypothetical protein
MADQMPITTDSLCLLIAVEARVERLPAQPWAMADAVSYAARHAEGSGSLSWLARVVTKRPGTVDNLTREAVQRLVISGELMPAGHGWHAGYEVTSQAQESARRQLAALPVRDQRVIEAASHRLVAMATIWSKNAVASRVPRSATS